MAFDAGTIEATLTLNRNPFTAGLAAARSQARGMERERFKVNVGVEVDQRQLLNAQAQLKTFAEKNVRAVARVLVERLQFDALLRDLKQFDRSRFTATVEVNTSGARGELDRLEAQMRGIRDRTVDLNGATRAFGDAADDGFGRGASRFQRMAALFIGLSPLMASGLSAAVGVVGTLVSALAIAGVGAAAFAAVAIPTFERVSAAVAGGQAEIDKLPPSLRAAASAMQEMQSRYQELVRANEARVGEVMAGGFRVATIVLEQMQPVITAAADGFMRMNTIAQQFFRGAEFREYVSFLSEAVAPTMERLTQITFSFFAAFGNLTEAFYRFGGSRVLDMIVQGMADFATWTDRLGQNQTFLRFMESMERSIPAVGALLRDLLEFIINLTIGLEPLGSMIARVMSMILDGLNALPPELMSGITLGFLSMWAAIALGATGPVGLAIGAVAGLVVVLADLVTRNDAVRTSVQNMLDALEQRFLPLWNTIQSNIRTFVIPAFQDLVRVYSESLQPVIERLANFINDSVIPRFEGIVDTITGSLIPAIANFLIAIEPFVTFMVEQVGGLAVDAIDKLLATFDTALQNISALLNAFTALTKGDWETFWAEMGLIMSNNGDLMETLFGDFLNQVATTLSEEGVEIQTQWNQLWADVRTTLQQEEDDMDARWETFLGWLSDTFTGWSPEAQAEWNGYWQSLHDNALAFENFMDARWEEFLGWLSNTFTGWSPEAQAEWRGHWQNLHDTALAFETFMDNAWASFWGGIIIEQDGSQTRVQGSLNQFFENCRRTWDTTITNITNAWNAFWANVFAITNQSVTNVGNAFRRVANLFRDPINWVINVVLNDGILGAWNTVMGWIGQPALRAGRIPNLPMFASGGPIHGGIPGKDSVPILTMPGEYVLSKRAVDNMGGVNRVEMIHAAARGGRLDGLGATRRDGLARQALMRAVPADDAYGRAFAYGGVQPHVARAGDEINRLFGPFAGGIGGVGARANASDHPAGLALDFMTMRDVAKGHRVAAYMQQNASRLLVKYLIWQQQINKGGGWSRMEDRGSPTANHMDHVHASFLGSAQKGRGFLGDLWAQVVSWWSQIGGQVTGLFNGLMPGAIPGLGGPVGAAALNIPRALIQKALAALTAKLTALTTTIFGGGGGGANVSGPVVDQVRAVAARYGWDQGAQWADLSALIAKESGWNPNAANPRSSARGLFQKMTSIYGPVESTAAGQAQWGLNYIRGRYGSPSAAWAFHRRNNWYENGGWLMPGEGAYNETREPEAIFNRPQLSAIHRAINEPGSGSGGIDAETIRALIAELGPRELHVHMGPVYNPVGEPAVETFMTRARTANAMGLFGDE